LFGLVFGVDKVFSPVTTENFFLNSFVFRDVALTMREGLGVDVEVVELVIVVVLEATLVHLVEVVVVLVHVILAIVMECLVLAIILLVGALLVVVLLEILVLWLELLIKVGLEVLLKVLLLLLLLLLELGLLLLLLLLIIFSHKVLGEIWQRIELESRNIKLIKIIFGAKIAFDVYRIFIESIVKSLSGLNCFSNILELSVHSSRLGLKNLDC